jgi:hypothetical protein
MKECQAGGFGHDERPEMLVEYRAAIYPPQSIKMRADDREFADVFLSVGGVWSYAQVESVSNLTATIQVHGRTALNLACPVIKYLIPRVTANLKADLRSSRLLG